MDRLRQGLVKANAFSERIARQTSWPATRAPQWFLAIGLLIVIALGIDSRTNQVDRMMEAPQRFMVDGELATTTADAGYFMQMAKRFAQSGLLLRPPDQSFPNEYDPLEPLTKQQIRHFGLFQPGLALPYLLARWHQIFDVSLERAAYHLLLLGVVLSALATFAFFAVLGQPVFGLVGAASAALAWPVAFRMTVGMVDTDILNPTFFFAVLALLAKAVRSYPRGPAIAWMGIAGLVNMAFYLWYGKAAFLLLFLVGFVAAAIAQGWPRRHILIGVSLFILTSDPRQLLDTFSAVLGFERAYIGALQDFDHPAFRVGWDSIGEASRPPRFLLQIFFGSLIVYATCVLGMILWVLQDLRRALSAIPVLVFWGLFHVSGVRFALYATPMLWVGFAVGIIALAVQMEQMWVRRRGASGLPQVRITLRGLAALVIIAGLVPATLPKYYLSPPDLTQEELTVLRQVPDVIPSAVVAAPWSQGYAIGYYTGLPTIHDGGGGQISLKSTLFSRAMIQTDPTAAAAWLRAAVHFSERALRASYPALPSSVEMIGTDRDIYLFLPRGFAGQIPLLARIALAAPADATDRSSPVAGTTIEIAAPLVEERPARWGEFEKVTGSAEGALLYRLKASPAGG